MSQRDSGYARKPKEFYETPAWVTRALYPHLPARALSKIWECAAGAGKMSGVLSDWGTVLATDIESPSSDIAQCDFLASVAPPDVTAIITNPPYKQAEEFIEHALDQMRERRGLTAMLLRTDYDHAKTRARLFAGCPAFSKKVVLTKRIVWFEPEPGKKGKSPSFNHAWFIWDWQHRGPPSLAYGP